MDGATAPALALALVVVLAHVAVTDVVRLTITNRMVAVTLALAAAWVIALPGPPGWAPFAMALVLFAAGFALWLAGAMGGGDAKLLPVLGLAGGTAYIHVVLWTLFAASLLLVLAFTGLRLLAARGVPLSAAMRVRGADRRLPFGVPIAVAATAGILARTAAAFGW